jgi:hypothetical protein
MATKKEAAAHDCKAECADLYKQLATLKKEILSLKAELKKAPKGGGGADQRVDDIIKFIIGNWSNKAEKYNLK